MAWLGRGLLACALIGAACGEDGERLVESTPGRPAARPLGDSFCVDPPDVRGDLRTVYALYLDGLDVTTTAMGSDSQGTLLVGGVLFTSLKIGDRLLRGTTDGRQHPFLFAVGAEGDVLWARTYPDSWVPLGIRERGSGQFDVAAMSDQGRVDLGFGPIADPLFLARIGPNGDVASAVELPGVFADTATTVAMGPAGEVAIRDSVFSRLVVFRSGSEAWTTNAPSGLQGQLAFDDAGNLVVSGAVSGFFDWVTPARQISTPEALLAMFDPAGTMSWIRTTAGGSDLFGAGLSVAGGHIVTTTTTFTDTSAFNTASSLRYAADIEPTSAWTKRLPLDINAGGPMLAATEPDGSAYLFGTAGSYLDLGLGGSALPGSFLARVDANGVTTASAIYHGPVLAPASAVAIVPGPVGDAFFTGMFTGAIDLGTGVIHANQVAYGAAYIARVVRQPSPTFELRCGSGKGGGAVLGDPSTIVPVALALAGDTLAIATAGEIMAVTAAGGDPRVIAADQLTPVGVAADERSVYWATAGTTREDGDPAFDGMILSTPIGGGASRTLVDHVAGVIAIAIDDATLYFAVSPVNQGTSVTLGKLMSVPLQGGAPKLLASGFLEIGPIAAAGGDAVVLGRRADGGSATLARVTREGTSTTLAFTDRTTSGLAVEADTVYWLEFSPFALRPEGQLRSVPLGGGTPHVLASQLAFPIGLVSAAGALYFSEARELGANLMRLQVPPGGKPEPVATGFTSVGPLTADGARVAWVQRVDEVTWSLIVRGF